MNYQNNKRKLTQTTISPRFELVTSTNMEIQLDEGILYNGHTTLPAKITPTKPSGVLKKPSDCNDYSQTDDDHSVDVLLNPPITVDIEYPPMFKNNGIMPIIPGWTRLYSHEPFIDFFHKHLNGKIEVWKNKAKGLLYDIKQAGNQDNTKYKTMLHWADEKVTVTQRGIEAEKHICVPSMDDGVIIGCIGGIEDKEMVTFVKKMAFSDTFSLTLIPHSQYKSFDLVTTFDNNDTKRYEFGKRMIEQFDNL
jgi:hypothetical protein